LVQLSRDADRRDEVGLIGQPAFPARQFLHGENAQILCRLSALSRWKAGVFHHDLESVAARGIDNRLLRA